MMSSLAPALWKLLFVLALLLPGGFFLLPLLVMRRSFGRCAAKPTALDAG